MSKINKCWLIKLKINPKGVKIEEVNTIINMMLETTTKFKTDPTEITNVDKIDLFRFTSEAAVVDAEVTIKTKIVQQWTLRKTPKSCK